MEQYAGTQRTARGGRQRKPSRLLVARRRRAARKAEAYIASYRFPAHISRRVIRRTPQLDEASWPLVEQGLHEWFVCCAWRGRTILGMPSRLVDEAWHEFILDSLSYIRFCETAFGEYLHHTPDEAMSTPMPDALADTVRAWDRSAMGASDESVLWDLDDRIGVEQPLRVGGLQLTAARSRAPFPATGWACAAGGMASGGEGGGHHGAHGGGCSASGCSGGSSGCGGGGCGGGS
jgi:uncharacterized membrane protein YgcG